MKKLLLISCFAFALATVVANAQTASDIASNYSGGWTNGSNGGTGFSPWSIANNGDGAILFAGNFIGDSTAGAGNINTGTDSFGFYAYPGGAYVQADRAFNTALTTDDVFTFQLGLNNDNGNKGFSLFAGAQGLVFQFNVYPFTQVAAVNGATLNAGAGAGYNYGGNDAVINVSLAVTSSSQFSYNISRTSSQGFQGTLFSGTVTGLTSSIDGFRFYVIGTDDGTPQNNLYVNNLGVNVVPEPSTFALLGLGLAGLGIRRFKGRKSA